MTISKSTMKAILFCRVSTTRQEWESQKNELTEVALRDGFNEEDLIVNGKKESATKLDEEAREGIKEMKECIERGDVACVYVWEISRLSRRDYVLFDLKKYFIDHHIQLVCLKPSFRLLNSDGEVDGMAELAFAMYSSFSQIEIRNKEARARRGREVNALAMKKTGNSVRFGYKIDENRRYTIDEASATIVRRIYEMYNDGKGLRTIQREIQGLGYNLTIPTIRRIVRFEGYTGQATLKSGIVRNYPVIIDKETYDRAQEVKKQNNNWVDVKNKRVYVSIPLIRCECGRCYASTGGNNYRCTKSREEHSVQGHSPMIKQSIIDDLVFDLAYDAEIEFQKHSTKEEINRNEKAIAKKEKDLLVINKSIGGLSGKLDRINELYIDGNITKDVRDLKRERVRNERRELENKRVSIQREIEGHKMSNTFIKINILLSNASIPEEALLDSGSVEEINRKMKFYLQTLNVDAETKNSKFSLEDKKEIAKRHIEVIHLSKGKNLNSHIATIKMKNGIMYKYELNTRKKTNAVVLLETSHWS